MRVDDGGAASGAGSEGARGFLVFYSGANRVTPVIIEAIDGLFEVFCALRFRVFALGESVQSAELGRGGRPQWRRV
jgi:hypothetical protein